MGRRLLKPRHVVLLSIVGAGSSLGSACSEPPEILGGGSVGSGDGDTQSFGGMGGDNNQFFIPGDGDGDNGSGAGVSVGGAPSSAECGDGVIELPENCDDSNAADDDGCSSECVMEAGFACPVPGEACVQLAVCGDGNLGIGEECDDNNSLSGDGCTDRCFVETGWECPSAGARCVSVGCGDGIVAGNEQCEDNDDTPTSGDGCSDTCRVEPGYFCPTVGEECQETVCGNGVREGDEPCDDGNGDSGDGCTPLCEREPTCVNGACSSTCGDGMILAGDDDEDCDDGNTNDGDGCSSTCKVEDGYMCTLETEDLPDALDIPVIYRDFIGLGRGNDGAAEHPDFQAFTGDNVSPNLVLDTLLNGKPQYADICDDDGPNDGGTCPFGDQMTTRDNFNAWYSDGPLSMRLDSTLTLTRNMSGQYVFDSSGNNFYPLDGLGWVGTGDEDAVSGGHNFGFTTELRYWFELEGGEFLEFSGDDDVWVFLNNQLLLDIGGLHGEQARSVTLDAALRTTFGMEVGRIYEIVLFHAERRTNASNFKLTLNGFVRTSSSCEAQCGDGIVAGDEACDDGTELNGQYGYCQVDCTGLDERCGDGEVQEIRGEVCDDGTNLTSYDFNDAGGCAPGCQTPARCGDKHVDVAFGEQCDDGNDIDGDGCESNCTNRTSCGDGEIDTEDGELCDDGNRDNGDGCSQFCTPEVPVVR